MNLRATHWVARWVLRCAAPHSAVGLMRRISRAGRRLEGLDDAREADRVLGRSGTCLSRAVTVAARLPGAEVVIGVDTWRSVVPEAHAWVELDGAVFDQKGRREFGFGEIARLRIAPRTPTSL